MKNILFMSICEIKDSNSGYIYADLLKEFGLQGNNVFDVTPIRSGKEESFTDENGVKVIQVKNGQIQKTNKIKKFFNLLALEQRVIRAVNKHTKGVKFDAVFTIVSNLCLYKSTRYFKKKHNAYAYMLLKDIFPQNAVDMKMIKTTGIMGLAYSFFRNKEKRYYALADKIGYTSEAMRKYLLENNGNVVEDKMVFFPNSIATVDNSLTQQEIAEMRNKYNIPLDSLVFLYGGNFGKPQGIPFVLQCLHSQRNNSKVFFLIVGGGTEFKKIQDYIHAEGQKNALLIESLPRCDYEKVVAACDVGMIFLDHSFTMPNFPSRLLSYMSARLPVFACTDTATDIGDIIVQNKFGWWCESDNVNAFNDCVKSIEQSDLRALGNNAYDYFIQKYTVENVYGRIEKDF